MNIVILGGSGMLGEALVPEGKERGYTILAPCRGEVDIQRDDEMTGFIRHNRPDMVINAAAIINHAECEGSPDLAYRVNARPVATLANICREIEAELVQISSDQCAHPLVNEYAKTKAAGECFALSYDGGLVVRTNIVGPKNLEWAFRVIENDEPCTLYTNYRVSSIDVWAFSKALFDVLKEPSSGVINIGCRESFSKADFVQALADKMGRTLTNATMGKMLRRHPDLSMDVSKVESWLGYSLPTLDEVVNSVIERRKNVHWDEKNRVA